MPFGGWGKKASHSLPHRYFPFILVSKLRHVHIVLCLVALFFATERNPVHSKISLLASIYYPLLYHCFFFSFVNTITLHSRDTISLYTEKMLKKSAS